MADKIIDEIKKNAVKRKKFKNTKENQTENENEQNKGKCICLNSRQSWEYAERRRLT